MKVRISQEPGFETKSRPFKNAFPARESDAELGITEETRFWSQAEISFGEMSAALGKFPVKSKRKAQNSQLLSMNDLVRLME
jgi:hypothetical protein